MKTADIHIVKTGSLEGYFSKSFFYSVFLFFNLMITYRVLLISFIPQVELLLEAIYEVVIILYLIYRFIRRIAISDYSFNWLELYLAGFMILPVLPAYAAYREFGQPMFYGLATFRDFYLMFGALIMYNMLRSGEVDIKMVEKAYLNTAWFSVGMFYALTLLTNPADFKDTGLAGANDLKGGVVYYRFNMAFIFFGSIYYSVKAFRERKPHYLIYAALFAFYVTYFRLDRTSIAVMGVALIAYFFGAVNLRRKYAFVMAATVPAILVLMIIYLFADKTWDKYETMFTDAFATSTGGVSQQGFESIRVYEAGIARQQIEKNPFWGNGKVSAQWVPGGYNYFFRYFYASDVGYLGQIFIYGYFGALYLYGQYLFALIFIVRIRHVKHNVFLQSLKYFLLALGLDSITTGYLTMYAAQTMTVVILIYFFYEVDRKIDSQLAHGQEPNSLELRFGGNSTQ